MESHVKEQGCVGPRALGTAAWVTSILLAFALGGPAVYAQPGGSQAVVPANPPAGTVDPVREQVNSLSQRRDELAVKARQRELQLTQLVNETTARQAQILGDLRQIREQMRGVEQDLVRLGEQSRQQLESQVARAQNRVRSLTEQAEKLRVETSQVQVQMEQAQVQNRRQAEMIASALEQTRRQIRATEDRLNGVGITYQARVETSVPNQALPVESGRLAGTPAAPASGVGQPTRVIRPAPADGVRDLQEEIRRLRSDVQELANRPQPPDPTVRTDLQQLRMKLDAVQQQVQQTQEYMQRRVPVDNPYCVGSAGDGLYRSGGW
jgi:hypothetical protein